MSGTFFISAAADPAHDQRKDRQQERAGEQAYRCVDAMVAQAVSENVWRGK